MKFILYAWGSNSDNILRDSLIELGYVVSIFEYKCEHYTRDLNMANCLINCIHEENADAVISFDYFPIISMVCNTIGIVYYSWVYDCPHYTLFAKTTGYGCNKIGCFDKVLVDRLNTLGIDTVVHVPLGVSWPNFVKKNKRYRCDISFVGSLYTGEYDYYDKIISDKVLKQKVDECVVKQCFNYTEDHSSSFWRTDKRDRDLRLDERVYKILSDNELLPGEEYFEDIEYIFNSSFLEKKVTIEERRALLRGITKLDCDFSLYTGSDLSDEPLLKKHSKGYVDYNGVMPLVFAQSRINLNITLRSIKSGIPLRALDIMGCGGFLLSNYQEELAEYFIENEELVMFYSYEDCMEKINYYLSHEDERSEIAQAGRRAVKERFDFKRQLEKLLGGK